MNIYEKALHIAAESKAKQGFCPLEITDGDIVVCGMNLETGECKGDTAGIAKCWVEHWIGKAKEAQR